jgi:uncharacterized protein YwbE
MDKEPLGKMIIVKEDQKTGGNIFKNVVQKIIIIL